MQKVFTVLVFFLSSLQAGAQNYTPTQYIEMYKDIAISEMKRMGVPAAITLAQGILESESGNSILVKRSNNHFGIKCKSTWIGDAVKHDDDAIGECFRKYETAEESYRDHSNFLKGNTRYSTLFNLDITDYKGWAKGLKKAGYATNPRYPEILIKNIEEYDLQQYTLTAIGDMPDHDKVIADNTSLASVTGSTEAGTMDITEVVDGRIDDIHDVSDKKLYINGSKCVFVKKGTSLLAVATKNNINLNKLLEFNELTKDGILEQDQYIYLQKKSKIGDGQYYITRPGETLYDVAQKNAIQLTGLQAYNNLTSAAGVIGEGTRLLLRPITVDTDISGQNEHTGTLLYTVSAKDSLYAIAKKYKLTVGQLKEWNNLAGNELRIGQELIVRR